MKRTRKGSLTNLREHEAPTTAPPRLQRTSGGPIVTLTVRFNREAWEVLREMAHSDNVSLNTLIYDACNEKCQARGLPPIPPVPPVTKQ